MVLAIAVSGGRVAPLFDTARCVRLLHLDHGQLSSSQELRLADDGTFGRVAALVRWDVDTVICGAITRQLSAALEGRGIEVIGLVAGEVGCVLEAYRGGALPGEEFSLPGSSST